MLQTVVPEKVKPAAAVASIPALVEDPVRRCYKRILAVTFISTCCLYVIIDLSFQVGMGRMSERGSIVNLAFMISLLMILILI